MKKIRLIALFIAILLVLCACASEPESIAEADPFEYLVLGEYKGLTFEKIDASISDYKLQIALNSKLYDLGYGKISDDKIEKGTVQIGDIINIDYEGKKDGVAFESGTAKGASLAIGSGQFIEGFEEGLVGAAIGETVTLNLTFPTNYRVADLAGQAVVFTVKINFISQRTTYPELTDEIAQKIDKEVKSKEELIKKIKNEMETSKQNTLFSALKNTLWSQVMTNTTFTEELPKKPLETATEQFTEYYTMIANQNNFSTLDEFFAANGLTQEKITQDATALVKQQLVSYAIAKEEGYTISEEDFNKVAKNLAGSAGYTDVDAYVQEVGRQNIEAQMTMDFALSCVLENAKAK